MSLDTREDGITEIKLEYDGYGLSVGVVQAKFNAEVTDKLWLICLQELQQLGVSEANILHVEVPGALEIPFVLQRLAETAQFDVLIALGCVIKGDTYHFEIVCNESARAISKLVHDLDLPIVNMILTTYDNDQAIERIEEKGIDAARTAVTMGNLNVSLEPLDMDETVENDPRF